MVCSAGLVCCLQLGLFVDLGGMLCLGMGWFELLFVLIVLVVILVV